MHIGRNRSSRAQNLLINNLKFPIAVGEFFILHSSFFIRLALYASVSVTACERLYLVNTYQVEVAVDGVLQS